jgi:hypothetical protein
MSNLDRVVDMVNHSIGDLQPDIPLITPTKSLDMYSFQSIVIMSNEDLLEAKVKGFEHSSLSLSRLLKNETCTHDHNPLSMSSALKNEIDPHPIYLNLQLDLIPKPSFPPPISFDPLSSSLSGEPILISI